MTEPQINERAVSRLASKYAVNPKIVEPRAFFDRVVFDGVNARGLVAPEVFRNGFKYPIQIKYIMLSMLEQNEYPPSSPILGDERMIQKYGVRIYDHGSWFMNGDFIPGPLWHNRTTAAADFISRAVSVWQFDHSFLLASRDSMEVKVSLELQTTSTRRVQVTFEGFGKISKVPYIFTGYAAITSADGTNEVDIPPDFFKNEGLEPVVITTMTINCGPDDEDVDPEGDIRDLNISIRQVGYGTNQDWITGPLNPIVFPRIPAQLLGISQGRCVVHCLPHDGWIWEPNEGVTVEIEQLFTPSRAGETVVIGMAGYLLVT